MEKILFIIGIGLISLASIKAQNVGINATGAAPDSSAMLDVSSTTSGMLIPRMTQNERTNIASPATGLLVYQTDATTGFYYYNGSNWVHLYSGSGNFWDIVGNSGTTAGTNFLGTTDSTSLSFKTNNTERMRILGSGNVGIGTTNPDHTLTVGQASGNTTIDFDDSIAHVSENEAYYVNDVWWNLDNSDYNSAPYSFKSSADVDDDQWTYFTIWGFVNSDGNITFYRKVSSEKDYDYLKFYIDNTLENSCSGDVAWGQVSYSVSTGWHRFMWIYSKDGSVSDGSDCAWVDDIVIPSSGSSTVWINGDLVVTGVKNFEMPYPKDKSKVIRYIAMEGGEAGTYIRGSSMISGKNQVINLPEDFQMVTAQNTVTVNITPRGPLPNFYVSEADASHFVLTLASPVKEKIPFDYLVMGTRKGYEDYHPIMAKGSASTNNIVANENISRPNAIESNKNNIIQQSTKSIFPKGKEILKVVPESVRNKMIEPSKLIEEARKNLPPKKS